jgi:hypothetical protein
MNDGSFTTTVSAAGLAPPQRQHLDASLRAEGIPVIWQGDTILIDQAFEARVESLVTDARAVAAGPAPQGAPAPGFVPTVTVPPGPAAGSYPPPAPGYPPPGYPPAPYPGAGYYPARITNSNATISLVLGIVAWLVCPVTAIFSIMYGRRAQDEIDASGGTQTGEGMAKAGIIMSWVLLGIYGLVLVGTLVFVILALIIGVASA